MAIIDFSEVIKLKEAVKKEFDEKVHFHDACGGQYFTLEKNDENLRNFITQYLEKDGYEVKFDTENSFVVEK